MCESSVPFYLRLSSLSTTRKPHYWQMLNSTCKEYVNLRKPPFSHLPSENQGWSCLMWGVSREPFWKLSRSPLGAQTYAPALGASHTKGQRQAEHPTSLFVSAWRINKLCKKKKKVTASPLPDFVRAHPSLLLSRMIFTALVEVRNSLWWYWKQFSLGIHRGLVPGAPVCDYPVAKSCQTLCNSVECSLPGSSVHRISQARILEWTAISFSRGSSRPRVRTSNRYQNPWVLKSLI